MDQENRMATDKELKEVLKLLADSCLLASQATTGFSFQEVTQLVKVAQDLPVVIRDGGVLWPEFKSLDDASRADLLTYVGENVKFPANANVELVVSQLLQVVISLSTVFQSFAAVSKP